MILVDTSIWVDHLRKGNALLSRLLEQGLVLIHPFVIGELACGSMVNRREILELLETLPGTGTAEHAEVLHLVEGKRLYGQGIGWVDAHLLASALLSHSFLFTLTRDFTGLPNPWGLPTAQAAEDSEDWTRSLLKTRTHQHNY